MNARRIMKAMVDGMAAPCLPVAGGWPVPQFI
jgi:hypothetical protein